MASIEGGRREIVVMRMNIEALEGIDRGFGPLPDVAHHVVKLAVGKFIDGMAGGAMIEMDIGCGWSSVRNLRQTRHLMEPIPFVLRGQSERLPGCRYFPVTESFSLMVIDLDRKSVV